MSPPMSRLSFQLARALSRGRKRRHMTRETILAGLLRKRAAAHRAGDDDQEAKLREQIRWALPVVDPDAAA